jgi:hypothetical protein
MHPPHLRVTSALVVTTVIASSLSVLGVTSRAVAIEKDECVAAYESTQKLQQDGKLVDAREQALTCAQEGCPAVVRDQCTQFAVEIEKATPTVVLVVTDPDGKDVTDVTVTIDDQKVTDHLDGKPMPIDVGKHKLRFEASGFAPTEMDILARAGEHDRTVEVKLGAAATTDTAPTDEGANTTGLSRPTPVATYIFAGLGVVSLGAFVAFGLSGNSKRKALDDANCKPTCDSSDVDAAKKSYLFADVSLGLSLVSFGVATLFYLSRGEDESKKEPEPTAGISNVKVDVAALKGGGAAVVGFSF